MHVELKPPFWYDVVVGLVISKIDKQYETVVTPLWVDVGNSRAPLPRPRGACLDLQNQVTEHRMNTPNFVASSA